MKTSKDSRHDRRDFFRIAGMLITGAALAPMSLTARAAGGGAEKMKIGVVGSGRVGGTIGELWVKAGYAVMFSSLDLEHDKALAARLGAGARAGTSRQAAAFGDALFIAVPYGALPQVGRDLGEALRGKIVLDACNPFPGRDGEMAIEARAKGTGVASPQFLPGARLVRAFNCVGYASMRSEAHRAGEKLGIPLAGDDPEAIKVAVRLVRDAGFEPVVVGGLARAKDFDAGTPIFGIPMTAAEVRRTLGIGS